MQGEEEILQMKILFWQWHSFMGKGIEKALQQMGVAYDSWFYQLRDWEEDEKFIQELEDKLKGQAYDAVLSVNYCPLITKVCMVHNVKYLSWVYDSPVHIRNVEPMKESCNRIYFFDRGQAENYAKQGIAAGHLPLAADCEVFEEAVKKQNADYSTQVSFVGQLYQTEYAEYMQPLNDYLRGYMEGIISAQSQVYGGYFLPEMITPKLMEELNVAYQKASNGRVRITERELEYLLAREITGRERYLALALLSSRYQVKLFTNEADARLDKVTFMPYVDYYTQMPQVFASSDINLNISLRTIQTGIPLRVLDVLACGGFLITNYQPELSEHFDLGSDLVVYEDAKDLVQKVDYYLAHEAERKQIAENGKQRIREDFSFAARLEILLGDM